MFLFHLVGAHDVKVRTAQNIAEFDASASLSAPNTHEMVSLKNTLFAYCWIYLDAVIYHAHQHRAN